MSGGSFGSPLEDELSPSFEDNHNGVSILTEPSHVLESEETQPAGSELQEFPPFQSAYVSYPMSDDEGGILSDGGVHLNPSQAHAEVLHLEVDMADPEAAENLELSSIPQSHSFLEDDENEDVHETVEDNTEAIHPSWSLGDDSVIPVHHVPSLPNEVLEVPQEQHHIQDDQEQNELSTLPHGLTYDQSTDSLPFFESENFNAFPSIGSQLSNTTSMSAVTILPIGESSGSVLSHVEFDNQAFPHIPLVFPPANVSIQSNVDSIIGIMDDDDFSPFNVPPANIIQVEDAQNNMPLADFLYSWSVNIRSESRKANRGPRLESFREFRTTTPTEVRSTDLRGEKCDIQGINWKKLEVKRRDARRMRIATYKNYQNQPPPPWLPFTLSRAVLKSDKEDFFKFRRMNFKYKINLSHFQLRNLIACTSRNSVFFAGTSRVIHLNPNYGQKCVRMNLSEPEVQPTHGVPWGGVQISTLAADHNVLIAGGFHGEYGMMSLSQPESKHVEGLVVDHPNCITNHIQIQLSRQSGLPEAVIASNDNGVRTLDCTTNKFIRHHEYGHAINCSAQSPDRRLRVLVGDTCNVMISNAETGEVLQELAGHFDYGFACAWADNGWHVATGNQDQLVKIWDARMWTTSDGQAKPLATIASTMAGVRSLKYSPLGSGKRVLLASEPADIISVIDAETYESKQTLDLFGEIAGTDFTPDGQNIFVGVHDSLRGGLMEFEKCGFGRSYEHESIFRKRDRDVGMYDGDEVEENMKDMAAGLDWKRTMRDVVADPKSKRTATHRRRRAARLGDLEPY